MTLIVHEIYSEVFQSFVPTKNQIVSAVRPHLYIHNNPSGSLKVQICSSDHEVLGESEEINISTITTAPEFHGYVTFYVDAYLLKNTSYKFKIVSANGYSFSESAYCAVCNDYDLRKYNSVSPVNHSWLSPLDIEIWCLSTN